MLKKTVSILLVLCAVCCWLLPAAAQNEIGPIAVQLNSNIAGLTEKDAAKLIVLQTNNVKLKTRDGGPISIANYAGTQESGALVAGRTYTIYYSLEAADGYVLPDQLADGDVSITCGKGVSVIATQIVSVTRRNDDGTPEYYKGLRIYAKVLVDGNFFQRIIGALTDLFLKARAWSLY